ncbi:MAG: PAS domain S-box protein, partial [Anaerolineae bacterium]|nr:PAS domain S-box protein [Anaerolineae bacterium]
QSFIGMALYPKVGKPWQFVLNQCSYPRVWSPEETQLFQEIGRRLEDSLGTLLAYQQLQDSEARYRLMAENTADTITIFDFNLKPVYVSPSVFRLRGYTAEETMAQSPDQILTPASLQTVNKLLAGQTALGADETADPARTVLLELELYCKNGATIWVELAASILRDTHLKPTGTLAVVRDITERKQAEDALRQNREAALQFSAQLAALQQVTIQLSKAESSDDLCQRAVELACSHLGFDRVGIWFIEEDRGFLRGSFGTDEQGKLRDERDLRTEFRQEGLGWQVFSQKQPVACSERTTLVHQGQELGEGTLAAGALWDGDQVIGLVYTDNLISHQPITEQQLEILRLYATTLGHLLERKWAEEERERLTIQIREQARELRHILATVPEGVLLLDSERRIVQANPVAAKDLATLAGVKVGDILTHLGDRSLSELLTSPSTKGLWHEVKVDQRVFEVIARPMENGLEPEHWVLVINDATQAREVREQLQQQERMAAVGQLAAGIAHDFNNIMAIIILYAQMTAKVETLPAHVLERMVVINQQARHATRLIQQILDFSRKSVLERQPLDILPLLKEQCKLLERTLPENIEISLDYEPAEYIVNADLTRIQQVIINLAINARDAMPNGGKLCFTLSRTLITNKIRCVTCDEMPSGEWVRIVVTDTGSGIPSEVLPHIFEPFFTTKAPGQGTGLGLSQVYGIVGAHEGHIDVSTKTGKGTTFIIYLPPLLTQQPEPLILETQAVVSGRGETLLVVEDDATLRQALVDALGSLNYQVLEAANGQEALDTLQQSAREIALVISDLVMPEMGGQALFHAMRQRNLTLPVIMLSGHPMEQELQSLQAEGLAGWLLKPPDIEQLSHLLAQVLKKIG